MSKNKQGKKHIHILDGMSLYTRDKSPFFWGYLNIEGEIHKKSLKTTDRKEAERLLFQWKNELFAGEALDTIDNEISSPISNNHGVKVDTSSPVITKTDVSIKSTSSIQLFVYDDNQLSDNITFTVSISQIEDESISVGVVLFSGISLSFVIILLVVKIFIKRESRSFELTKWNSKK